MILERNVLCDATGLSRARTLHAADGLAERDSDVAARVLNRGQSRPYAADGAEISVSAHLFSSLSLNALCLDGAASSLNFEVGSILYTPTGAKGYTYAAAHRLGRVFPGEAQDACRRRIHSALR